MTSWSAVFAKPRHEELARENLERQGFRTYLPMLKQPKRRRGRWAEVVEPLFPRYLFVELAFGTQDISPIRSTLGVVNLVRFGQQPAVAPEGLVESLIASEDPVAGCHLAQPDPFKKGDRVIVVSGPFAGIQAIFDAPSGEGRVALLLELLGRTNRVEVDRNRLVAVT